MAEFETFIIKVETPEDAELLVCLLEWESQALEKIALAVTDEDMDISARIGSLAKYGHTGQALWEQIPEPRAFEWGDSLPPCKIGCRAIRYSSKGAEFTNPTGGKLNLDTKQLRAMADKCEALAKEDDDG